MYKNKKIIALTRHNHTIMETGGEQRNFIRKETMIMSNKTSVQTTTRFTTFQIALVALMTAVTCIMGPLSIPIPISPVPISLTNLAIYFITCILGWKLGTLSYILYLCIGLAGLPVFSSFSSGFGKLFGPTGGYLIGFIFLAILSGICFEQTNNKIWQFLGLILGTAVCYLFGTGWLCYQADLTFYQGLWAGVIPYIPGDLVKIILAILFAPIIRRRLETAGFALR